MNKDNPFWDERFKDIFKTLCTRFYILTMLFIWGDIIFRSMILKQQTPHDLNMIMTLNVLLFIPAILYYSGLSFRKFKPLVLIVFYLLFVTVGTIFTILKYGVYEFQFIFEKVMIIASISAILMTLYVFFAWFGYRKMEKEIGDDS